MSVPARTFPPTFVRDAVIALSLANLSLIEIWNALLNYTPAQSFFFNQLPPRTQYAAAFLNVCLIGLLFFGLIQLARHAYYRYGVLVSAPIVFLMALPAAKALVRLCAANVPRLGPRGAVAMLVLLVAATAILARRNTFAAGSALLVTLSPMIAIEATVSYSRYRAERTAEYADGPLAPRTAHGARPRIVWIVYDELDYRLSFPGRPENLPMPEFDRLRAQSVFADHATSPSIATLHSILSLLTGRNLTNISTAGPSVVLANGAPLSSLPTIFSIVREMGGNAAADGWYLPYCRLFAGDLAACSWHEIDNILSETDGTLGESIALEDQSLFEYGYLSPFPQSLRARHRIRMLNSMTKEAQRYTSDASLDLVFLHLAAPHPPHFYDPASRSFTKRNAGPESYPSSLALADSILGEIRSSMTRAGLWDKTTVLISSDHQNRSGKAFDGKDDSRVPFLLKMPGQSTEVPFNLPLRTVVSKGLLEEILKGRVVTPEDAVRWLSISSSPSAR